MVFSYIYLKPKTPIDGIFAPLEEVFTIHNEARSPNYIPEAGREAQSGISNPLNS